MRRIRICSVLTCSVIGTYFFLRAILVHGYKVCVDVATALNTTVSGVYAHLSALKGGETLKVPVFGF